MTFRNPITPAVVTAFGSTDDAIYLDQRLQAVDGDRVRKAGKIGSAKGLTEHGQSHCDGNLR